MEVKANRPDLLWELERVCEDERLVTETGTRARAANKGHGRLEVRECRTSTALVGSTAWPGLAQVARGERTRVSTATGAVERATAYLVTSLPPGVADARALLKLDRAHWGIEHRAHWVRDEVLGEDRSRVRRGAAPQGLAALRNLVLAALRAHGHHQIKATREHLAGPAPDALYLIGLRRE
jgi:hypothetical protein